MPKSEPEEVLPDLDLRTEAQDLKAITVEVNGGTIHFPLSSEYTLRQSLELDSGEVGRILAVFEKILPAAEYELMLDLKSDQLEAVIEKAAEAEGVSLGESDSSASF